LSGSDFVCGGGAGSLVGEGSLDRIREVRGDVRVAPVDGPHLLLQVEAERAWGEIRGFLAGIGVG
jgi:hypothetical protein